MPSNGTTYQDTIDRSRPILENPDGTFSTEESITVEEGSLNNGRPTNIPSIWDGQRLSDDEAIQRAVESGMNFESYDTVDAAVAAAQERSAEIGVVREGDRKPPSGPKNMRDTMMASADRERQITYEQELERRRQELAGEQQADTPGNAEPAQGADIGLTMPAGAPNTPPGTPAPEDEGGILQTAGAVTSDVVTGLTREMPFAVANGVVRAFNETVDFAESASEAVSRIGPDGSEGAIRAAIGAIPGAGPALAQASQPGQDLPDVPELPQPESVTGQAVQTLSQFLAGFVGVGKVTKAANILQGASRASFLARGWLNGALAAGTVFDPHEERLSNLIQDIPALRNPVTEYLAADPADGEMEGRLKSALEDAALGPIADGIVGGIRAIRAARNLTRSVDDSLAFLDRADEGARADIERDVYRNGTPDGPAVTVSEPRRMEDQLDLINRSDEATGRNGLTPTEAQRVVSGTTVPGYTLSDGRELSINMNALNTEEDIQATISQMADIFAPELEGTRRGVRGNATVIQDLQTQSGWDALNMRRVGQPLSDSETLAAQSLYVTSGSNVRSAIAHALEHPDSTAAQFAARRALTVHRAIQAQIAGAKADAGRALRAWGIPAEATANARREMENIVDLHGGRLSEKDLTRLQEIAGDAGRLDTATRRGFHPVAEVASEWIRFAFLGNPLTQAANLIGNTFAIAYDTLPRLGAGVQGLLFDDPALTRELRSVLDEYAGLAAGARVQFANFARTADYARMGRTLAEAAQRPTLRGKLMGTGAAIARDNPISATFRGRFDDFGSSGQKWVDTNGGSRAVSAERFGAQGGTMWGNFLNASGAVLSAPQEFLGFADDFFKGINHYSTRYRLAARQARDELGEGASREQYTSRMRELIENPTDDALEEAVNVARMRTFTEPIGKNTRAILDLRNTLNRGGLPLGSLLMPFVVTPSNILKFAFRNSITGLMWKDLWDDLGAGGVRAATARSRIASGTILAFIGADMVANGQLTGRLPEDQGERDRWERMGIQPYSLKTPWGWMSYRRMEPVSTMLAIGADMQMVMQNGFEDTDEPIDIVDVVFPSIGAAIQVVGDKSFLTGISQFIEFAQDPARYGPTYGRQLMSSVVVPSAVFQAERLVDPVIRDNSNIMNRVMGSVPGFSERVPPRRDLWGRVRRIESRVGELYDALSPWAIRANDREPIDEELARLGDAPQMPGWTISVRGSVGVTAPVNLRHRPDIYWRYVELAGNEAPSMPGRMGLRDYLNAVVSGEHPHSAFYERLPDDPSAPVSKASFIRDRIQDSRDVARAMLEREYRDELRAMADSSLVRQTEEQARREQSFEQTGR